MKKQTTNYPNLSIPLSDCSADVDGLADRVHPDVLGDTSVSIGSVPRSIYMVKNCKLIVLRVNYYLNQRPDILPYSEEVVC